MKKLNLFSVLIVACLCVVFSCKKYDAKIKAVISTGNITNVFAAQAQATGSITAIGELNIIQHGHCWSSANDVPDVRINQGKYLLGPKSSDGNFTSYLQNLYPKTEYFVRSFYITETDTIYGNDIKYFTTNDTTAQLAPNVATGADSAVFPFSFSVKGFVLNIGSSTVINYGHCYSISNANPTIADNKTTLGTTSAPINFTSNISGLNEQTKYYVRAYATNGTGTAYGTVIEVTTPKNTNFASITTIDSFEFNGWDKDFRLFGNLNSAGNDVITTIGHAYSTDGSVEPTAKDNLSLIDPNVTQLGAYNTGDKSTVLDPLTTYYYRAFAQNSSGVAYGNTYSYTTGFIGNTTVFSPNGKQSSVRHATVSTVYKGEFYYGLGIMSNATQQPTSGQWRKYDPVSNVFTFLKDCPYAISYGNCFEYNGIIYVMGGIVNGNTSISMLISYNPSSDAWKVEKTYNFSIWGSAGFLIDDKYYLCGGSTEVLLGNTRLKLFRDKTTVLDMTNFSLKDVASLPSAPRSNASGFTINGIGYVVAGMKNYSSPVGLAECWAYNPKKDEWDRRENVPLSSGINGVAFGAASTYGEFGYFIGGIENLVPNLSLSRFDPKTNTWKVVQNVPKSRIISVGTANFVDKKLVYGTGLLSNGTYTSNLYILD